MSEITTSDLRHLEPGRWYSLDEIHDHPLIKLNQGLKDARLTYPEPGIRKTKIRRGSVDQQPSPVQAPKRAGLAGIGP